MLTKLRHEFQTYIQQIWNWSQVLVRCDYSTITGEGKRFTCRTSSSLIPPVYWHWKALFFFIFFLKESLRKKDLGLFACVFFYQCSSAWRFFLGKKLMNTKLSQVEKITTGVAWLRSFWSCTGFSRDTASELPEIMLPPKKKQQALQGPMGHSAGWTLLRSSFDVQHVLHRRKPCYGRWNLNQRERKKDEHLWGLHKSHTLLAAILDRRNTGLA